MSTFFRSAAMSLLSRTLQTLLSKYLSDVDVEGVALPSLYSSDGQSGWGVRLSNVKLREGAKLMDLPGKPKKKKSKRRGKKKTTAGGATDSTGAGKDSGGLPRKTSDSKHGEEQTVPTIAESDTDPVSSAAPVVVTETAPSKSWFYWGSKSKSGSLPSVVPEETAVVDVLPDETELSSKSAVADNTKKESTTQDSDVFDDDDDDEDGDDDDDPPMILRLGEGGTIGILDVRLVGKSIHVLVEDAFLTIEAVQLEPDDGEEGKEGTKAPEKAKPQKKVLDPTLVGDRVLAENAIARALSAIPNLFLRDINVRFVVRDQIIPATPIDEEEGGEEQVDENEQQEQPPSQQPSVDSSNDVVVEFGIEFLSVTDGEDFMANFRGEDGDSSDGEDSDEEVKSQMQNLASFDTPYNQNEFFTKRIRTGRGPEGGIMLRVFPPGVASFNTDSSAGETPQWARRSWLEATQQCTLRLSGFDLLARIYLGAKEDAGVDSGDWYADEYDEYTVDSMLFGVDYIAPGPKPPLQPMPRRGASTIVDGEEIFWDHPGATSYLAGVNGIQSSSLESSFYRVGRGLVPGAVCDRDHLPCEWCPRCWSGAPGIATKHELDSSTPMPGLVLNVTTRDPIEVNIDRPSLEAIGTIVSLFASTQPTPDSQTPASVASGEVVQLAGVNGDMDGSEKSRSSYMSQRGQDDLAGSQRSMSGVPKRIATQNSLLGAFRQEPPNEKEEEDTEDCFPVYMQPEKIQIIGLHLSEIKFRIHVMEADQEHDHGLAFCYWDVLAKCVTMDQQKLVAPEKEFQDVRLDVGFFKVTEFKGVERRQLVTLGMKQRVVDFDEMTVETLKTREGTTQRPPWPSSGAALLEVQPPLETLVYEARDRHALQLRYITVKDPDVDRNTVRTQMNIRVGVTSVDAQMAVRTQIRTVLSESRESVLGPRPNVKPETAAPAAPIDSLMKYKVQVDGGHVRLDPVIDISLPMTAFGGERSSGAGLLFETLLDRVKFRYGTGARPTDSCSRALSLEQLAELSDNVRLRVLLFLKDLKPLEIALGVKHEENSFKSCRAVNKGIVKMARKAGRTKHSRTIDYERKPTSRRQEMMTELLEMDEDSLEELLKFQKRAAKKRANTSQF